MAVAYFIDATAFFMQQKTDPATSELQNIRKPTRNVNCLLHFELEFTPK